TFMLDLVVCALVIVVPVLAWSIYLAKLKRDYTGHKRVQLGLAAVLLLTVAAFEIDVQWMHGGWQNIVRGARPSVTDEQLAYIRNVLLVHLLFAISTPLLWVVTIVQALRRFGNPPVPSTHSPWH